MYILVIEDNPDIVENIYDFFEAHGHTIDAAYTANSGLLFIQQNHYDAVVLDLTLPDGNGLDLCSTLREQGFNLPILMLTARDTLDDKLLGFKRGTDDYLVKPFSLQELEVRLQSLVRRTQSDVGKTVLRIAELEFNPVTLRVKREGQTITLPPIPLKILALLMRQSPQIVTRQEIEQHIWGENLPETDSLRAHLHTLRVLIDKPYQSSLLQTMRGIGYRIVAPDAL